MTTLGVDVDAVLADIHPAFLQTYNERNGTNYTTEDITHWEWPLEVIGIEEFLNVTNEEWAKTEKLQPAEPNISERFQNLCDLCEVHIVTARSGCDEEIQRWFDHQGIYGYESFNSGVHEKQTLGLDYYVDDNPNMVDKIQDDQFLFLRAQNWNSEPDRRNAQRVNSLSDVTNKLSE